jgi:putative ABC transport system permease protein
VIGRARADLVALLLMVAVIALTTMLTSAVPPLAERFSDRAVVEAVASAGPAGAVTVTSPVRVGDGNRSRDPRAAAQVAQDLALARLEVPKRLARVLQPPVGTLTSSELQVLGGGPGRYLRLAYVAGAQGTPAVTWTAGRPPAASAPGIVAVPDGVPWPVQVGLTQEAARALGVGVGDRLSTQDSRSRPVLVRVSGLFVARDTSAGPWRVVPQLLEPSEAVGAGGRTTVTGLVSDRSVPDLRLAVPADDLISGVTFTPRAGALSWRATASLASAVVALKATPSGFGDGFTPRSWDSRLDDVLQRAHDEASAARAQAAVLVIGLLLGAGLVLALAAQLLVQRRTTALVVARERGTGLVSTGAELLVESVSVATLGAVLGLAATWFLVGSASWAWSLPVALVGVLAAPVLGVVVAGRATAVRQVPANRAARRRLTGARRARRALVEVTVLSVAAASVVALGQRGVVPPAGEDGPDLLAVGAPTWVVVAVALLLLRAVPLVLRLALSRARGSTRSVAFFSAAGSVADAGRSLPFLVVAVSVAQLVIGVSLAATVQQGQQSGAWRSVGADARLQADPSSSLVSLLPRVRRSSGVQAAVAARVADGVLASSGQASVQVRLVVLDTKAYAVLLARTPFPAPSLQLIRGRSDPQRVPALLSGGGSGLRDDLRVRWEDTAVPLDAVGRAPSILAGGGPVVVVDAARFEAAGRSAPADTLWAVGPGAGAALGAVRATAGSSAPVVLRSEVLAGRRDAPLVRGLLGLSVLAGALLLALGVLGVVLAAAVGARDRLGSLARLRTLGLSQREATSVLAGQLVPPVLLAALAGLLLGAGTAAYTLGWVDLDLLTGQTDGVRVVVPWWSALALLPPAAAAVVVTLVESSRRRRTSLGQLLRVGGD